VRSLHGPEGSGSDAVTEEFRSAAQQLGLPMERAEAAPCAPPRLLTLAAHDDSAVADLPLPPLKHLRALLPLGHGEAEGDLGLAITVRAQPVGPATVQDVAILNRELGSHWGANRHAPPVVRARLAPLVLRGRALMDDCAGLTVSVSLHGSEAPGWFVQRCLERRLSRDLKLDAGWVTGPPRWHGARADSLRVLLTLGIVW